MIADRKGNLLIARSYKDQDRTGAELLERFLSTRVGNEGEDRELPFIIDLDNETVCTY